MKITKKIIFGAGLLVAGICFSGCMDLLDALLGEEGGGEYSSEKIVTATETENWTYNASNPIFEADSGVLSVKISGNIGGKSLYVVNANKSSSVISNKTQRFVEGTSRSAHENGAASEIFSKVDESAFANKKGHYHPEIDIKSLLAQKDAGSSRSVLKSVASTVTEQTYSVGDNRDIWVDNSSDMDSYAKKTATLRAKGDNCYVWVVNDYYTTGTASGASVDTTIARKFANTFDAIYPMITNVFGNESDNLIDYSNSTDTTYSTLPMEGYCSTGKKINIVIYDIGADSSLPEDKQTGVLGYFYSKDYITNISETTKARMKLQGSALAYTNGGKYFYIDSAFSVKEVDSVLSTLAHEFQHMVNFGQKTMKNIDSPTAYNEMLSMLCEDMMQNKLELDDETSVKGERIPGFNSYYYLSGIAEYRNDENQVISYSTAYTFGAWLCRQYSGADLVKEMSQNSYGGKQSIVNAVNNVNYTNYSFDDLFKQFLLMLTGSSTYTMNKNAKQGLTYPSSGSATYRYPMTAIDLWSDANKIPEELYSSLRNAKYSDYNWNGPFLFANNYASALRPNYGINIHKIETFSSGTTSKTITFSSSGNQDLKLYLIIQ